MFIWDEHPQFFRGARELPCALGDPPDEAPSPVDVTVTRHRVIVREYGTTGAHTGLSEILTAHTV